MINKVMNIMAKAFRDYTSVDALSDDFFIFDIYPDDMEEHRIITTSFPIRVNHSIGILCEEGCLRINIAHNSHIVQKNELINIFPNKIFQVTSASEDFKAKVICLKSASFDFSGTKYPFNYNTHNLFRKHIHITLPPLKVKLFISLFDTIRNTILEDSNLCRKQIIDSYISVLHFEVYNLLINEKGEKKMDESSNEKIFEKFMKDVEVHFREERCVGFYANKMNLTPKYFSTLIFRITDKHAKHWIDEYTILEAKTLLKNTGFTIQQIGYELNFATPSHFSRYFKHQTGISPYQYRND